MAKHGRRLRFRWWWLVPILLLVVLVAMVVWAETGPRPMAEALQAVQSGGNVQVQDEPWLTFQPTDAQPTTGLVLYPGGRIDPRSYAPAARSIAGHGHLVVIVPVPLNLAVLAPDRAGDVIAHFPQVEHWAVGGHSLGGTMAASFASSHGAVVDGLVLWASYPAASDDLSQANIAAVSMYGTRDGLATPSEIEASRGRLPASTRWVDIEGGNHAQFGWYGPQPGDNEATVTRQEQQEQVVQATLDMLDVLD